MLLDPAAAATAPAAPGPVADARPSAPASFGDLGLPEQLLAAVGALGFTTPTAIQAAAIPALVAGRDVVGVAQTGTGKTAAFTLPLLAAVEPGARHVQALVLTPTRELAIQVADAVTDLASTTVGLGVVPVYGGAGVEVQRRGLARGAQVAVGTPGRVIDLIERGILDLAAVRYVVLDEADEMLRMGFAEDVDRILRDVPSRRQVALFSATMPAAIRAVARAHLTDPVDVTASRPASTVDGVEQTYAVVPFRHKIGALARVLATTEADATIVFVRTRGTAHDVGAGLVERGVKAAVISGEVPQADRERIVGRLRAGSLDVVVATDVAARGLDVERIGLVVNFDLPAEPEAYVHRIGRTGRAGRSGRALSFVTPRELGRLRGIERLTRVALTPVTVPGTADVAAHKAHRLVASVAARRQAGGLEPFRTCVAAFLEEHDVEAAELAAVLLALAVEDDMPAAADDPDAGATRGPRTVPARSGAGGATAARPDGAARDVPERGSPPGEHRAGQDDRPPGRREGGRRPSRRHHGVGTRYRLAVGHAHGARPEAIVGAITGEGRLRGEALGKIDIFPRFSLVEIAGELSPEASRRIAAARVAGRPLRIRLDEGPPVRPPSPRPLTSRASLARP